MDALPFLQLHISCSKTDIFRKDVLVTVSNTSLEFGLYPLLAFFRGWADRVKNGERLVGGSFVFGITEKKVAVPLRGSFSNDMYKSIATCMFGKEKQNVLRTHSCRKGGSTTLMAAGGIETEVRLLGRWSLGVLNFYLSTPPERFAELQLKMARWALGVISSPEYVRPLNIS